MTTRMIHVAVVSMFVLLLGAGPVGAQPVTCPSSQVVAFDAAPIDPPTTKKAQDNPYNAKNQLDLNSAPKPELVKLPGIGDAYADAIIKNRPYANKTQIKSKAGVPAAVYDKIADMIVAKQAK
jgi:competence protein ComEA